MFNHLSETSAYAETAGKITLATAVGAVAIFSIAFLFNAGKNEIQKVAAQTATTTLTVLNTPPQWTNLAVEEFVSSTSSPTNSGSEISWVGTGTDANDQNYYLLVCSTATAPTPINAGAPRCTDGVQWAVSPVASSGVQARAATTTTQVAPFSGEILSWFAWICDSDPVNARCNSTFSQGTNATNSSPFVVNFRPVFTSFTNNGPVIPGGTLTFTTVSSDSSNFKPGPDFLYLYVCSTASFTVSTLTCGGQLLASTTGTFTSNTEAAFQITIPTQDTSYNAFGFLVDQWGHAAQAGAQGSNAPYVVNNVAPSINGAQISLNGGNNIVLTVPAGETTGFTLSYTVNDNNSCLAFGGGAELTNYNIAIHRSGIATTTCNGSAGSYNPNNCYSSGVATTTWNLSCTRDVATCAGASDVNEVWNCTFPLWFLTDSTASFSQFDAQQWVATVAAIDNNNATGTRTTSSIGVDVGSLQTFDLLTAEIAYGALEPGQASAQNATATVVATGNTGINQSLEGFPMCTGFNFALNPNVCGPVFNPANTIPDNQQQFSSTTFAHGFGIQLSSTTDQLLELRVPKTTSTTNLSRGVVHWAIFVPTAITVAGAYSGLNFFYVASSSSAFW